jgi:hypothetical protein
MDEVGRNFERGLSLSLAAAESGPNKLYTNDGRAAGSDDEQFFMPNRYPVDYCSYKLANNCGRAISTE